MHAASTRVRLLEAVWKDVGLAISEGVGCPPLAMRAACRAEP